MCDETDSNHNESKSQYCSMVVLFEKIVLWYPPAWFSCDAVSQFIDGAKGGHHLLIHEDLERIRTIKTFEYKRLLLLKSPENTIVALNMV